MVSGHRPTGKVIGLGTAHDSLQVCSGGRTYASGLMFSAKQKEDKRKISLENAKADRLFLEWRRLIAYASA